MLYAALPVFTELFFQRLLLESATYCETTISVINYIRTYPHVQKQSHFPHLSLTRTGPEISHTYMSFHMSYTVKKKKKIQKKPASVLRLVC